MILLGLLASHISVLSLALPWTTGVWRDRNLQALSPRSPSHLASRGIQPMGGNDKRRVGDARTFFSLFTVSWYLSGVIRDIPSTAPFTAAQDCGTQFFRMPSVPGIQEHDILFNHAASGCKWLDVANSPVASFPLFGFWTPSVPLKPIFYFEFPLLWILKVVSVFLVKVKLLSRVRLFATPWTVAHQAPLSMGFSRQEYWSRLPFPSPGDLPNPGIEPRSPAVL